MLDELLQSPCCRAELQPRDGRRACVRCATMFEREDQIWRLSWPRDAQASSPRFDPADEPQSLRALIDRCRRDPATRALGESIPHNTSVLVVGCGTGQLVNYLGISCRRVVGTDASLAALRRAEAFRAQHGLARVRFLQMSGSQPALRAARFDVAICELRGPDELDRLECIAGAVAPGGHVVLRSARISIAAMLQAFERCGLDIVRGLPDLVPGASPPARGELFQPAPGGSALDHFLVQAGGLGSRLRLLIGRKPAPPRLDRESAPELENVRSSSS
jgi:SAM-dependent methyltransferase